MKKKMYERPTIQVVQLKHKCQILAGSVGATRGEDYGDAIEETWEE